MINVLSCISKSSFLQFEEAVMEFPLTQFCNKNNYNLHRFNIHEYVTKHNAEATFIYLYKKIAEESIDIVIIPLTNNKEYNLILDPSKTGNAKIVYIITGDIEENHSILPYIPQNFYIIGLNEMHDKHLSGRSNYVRIHPFYNDYVFYREDDIMQEAITLEGEKEQKRQETAILNHEIDVAFFGKMTEERAVYLSKLSTNGIDVRAYGSGWSDGFESFEFNGIKTAPRKNLSFEREILTRSKIGVVIDQYIKPIHLEIPACNALLITKKTDGSAKYFKPCRVPTFGTPEDLLKVVNKYLNNPEERKKLTQKLKEHVKINYGAEKFFAEVFSKVQE